MSDDNKIIVGHIDPNKIYGQIYDNYDHSIVAADTMYSTKCLICNEVITSKDHPISNICDKCRDAILTLRKYLED